MNLEDIIKLLPKEQQEKIFDDVRLYEMTRDRERAQVDFLAFVKAMWPVFIDGRHHALMADKFEQIARGEIKRLIINMPPRQIGRAHV